MPFDGARLIHEGSHVHDGRLQAAEYSFTDQKMADVELDDFRDTRHGAYCVERQAVSGMNFETSRRREARCRFQPPELDSHARRIVFQSLLAV